MLRDGANKSLWQAGTSFTPKYTTIPAQTFDVVVVGGGITGIATALELQKLGKQTLVLESHNLCFGTSGGTTAHLNTFLDTDYKMIKDDFGEAAAQQVAAATRQSLDLIKQNIADFGIECGFGEKDAYVFAQDEKQTDQLNDIYQCSQNAGADCGWSSELPVPIEHKKVLKYPGNAQFHPVEYVYGIAKALEEAGGVIIEGCRVTGVKGEAILDVETTLGPVQASYLVYATHTPPGVNVLHFRAAPYRSYAVALKLEDEAYPDALVYDMHDPYHYYRTQEVDGQKYLIAGGEDHKTAAEQDTDKPFDNLLQYLRKHFKIGEEAFRWSSQYFEPADGLAYIGHLPGNPDNVYVATGLGGNGMTYSHIAAITLSDLIVKGHALYADLFKPGRVNTAELGTLVKETFGGLTETIKLFFGKEKIEGFSALAKGEGKLVKYDGNTIGLYKDEGGAVHAVSPVCPHAKCVVGWNSTEKSWDCPCHGSRFSPDGEILTAPARCGLNKVEFAEQ